MRCGSERGHRNAEKQFAKRESNGGSLGSLPVWRIEVEMRAASPAACADRIGSGDGRQRIGVRWSLLTFSSLGCSLLHNRTSVG